MKLSIIASAGFAVLLSMSAHAYQSGEQCDAACKALKQEKKTTRSNSREDARQRQLRLYEECLRKADWPGTPTRAECQAMYQK